VKFVNEQLLAFIGEPVLDAMQRVIAHMFYLPGKVIDTIERERIGCTIYLSFSSYSKSTAQQPGKDHDHCGRASGVSEETLT
jgi:hypothetical protein